MQYNPSSVCFQFGRQWQRQIRRSWAVFLALLTASIVTLASCVQEPPQPLRVGLVNWIGFSHLHLAETLDYYKGTSIRLLDYPSGAELFQAFRNGELEVVATTIGDALLLAETNPNFRIILVTDSSDGADVILAKPSVATLQDLAGKRVGVEAIGVGAYMLNRALEKVSLATNDVQLVSVSFSEQEAAYREGRLDALVTFDPVRSRLLAEGAKQLFDSSQIPGEIVDVLVVGSDTLTRHQTSLQQLVQGWFQALNYFQQHPEDAASKLTPFTGLSPEQFIASLQGIRFPTLAENQMLLGKTDSPLLDGTKRLNEMMVKQRLLNQSVDSTSLLDDQLVSNIKL